MSNNNDTISRRCALKYMGIGAVGAATIFTGIGCGKTDKNAIIDGGEIRALRIKDKVSDAKISLLGFGCMRFPVKDENDRSSIDEEAAMEMIDYAYKHGVNFFDTAWFYHQGQSEPFVGKALKRYPRESVYIATKMPIFPLTGADPNGLLKSEGALNRAKEVLNLQLERLQTDYIDFYFLHSINNFQQYKETFVETGILDYLLEQKEKGVIRRIGFSFHGPNEEFPKIAEAFDWEFSMIQVNYYDWEEEVSDAKFLHEVLEKNGIQAIYMEPVRGGMLANLTPDANKILQDAEPDMSIASWAIRWCATLPNTMNVLSGMSTLEQVKDNVRTLSEGNFKPLTADDHKIVDAALAEHMKAPLTMCTYCDYCMSPPCPAGINIPLVFSTYDECVAEGNVPNLLLRRASDRSRHRETLDKQSRAFLAKMDKIPRMRRADRCTQCNECIPKCPNEINIVEEMNKIADLVKTLESAR